MEQKLEDLVAKLRQPPQPARPMARPRPPVPAAERLAKPGWSWPRLELPVAGSLGVNLAWGVAALAIIAGGVWLALPAAPPPVATAEIAPLPPAPPAIAKITLPLPAAAPAKIPETPPARQAEAPPPVPPVAKLAALPPPVLQETAPPAAAPQNVAALPPPPPAKASEPAWLRFAVPPVPAKGRPQIAIILDDVGVDHKGALRAITLPGPLTFSFMAYAEDLPALTAAAHRAGDELMVHVPMQPLSASEDMGPNGLSVDLDREEVLRRLRWDLSRFSGYVGINNHMGSRFTADPTGMSWVLEELKGRGLFFLDSLTAPNSVGIPLARKLGVVHAARDVFLDDVIKPEAIAAQLAEAEKVAQHRGNCIAIGHPHDATLDVLQRWIPEARAKGFVLEPVTAIIRERMGVAGG
jgi:uncharacterized protein